MTQYSRRTLVRGAAWSIPVVAMAAQAPAFAASTDAPKPSALEGCRLTAGGSSNCYRFVLSFAQPLYTWNIALTSVVLTNSSTPAGEEVIGQTSPTTFTVSATSTNNVFQIVACTTGNLQSAVNVKFTYDAQRTGAAPEQVVAAFSLTNIPPCK